ncbi:hypothetical protein F2Q69_00026777 [Brassica cretica]|uniref:Cytochrome c-type biogenesis protein n=1 Tax=Brassica cretica TaxID=69181 RepID=A0A8S9S9U8_BRACR|nr:hypothetical protein F2Q69_00026777 [Brassica cretica]
MEVMICLNECAAFTGEMEKRDEDLKKAQMLDARARNISHNVRCTECGSQSIEDSQADVAILLRQLIRDEIGAGKTDKEIYSKLEDEFGETVLYAPKFDMQTAALWLTPVLIAGGTAGGLVYSKHRQRTNVHIMALDLIRGVSLTPKERVTILDLLIPPPPPPLGVASRLRRWLNLR